jgi:hypothetical protein
MWSIGVVKEIINSRDVLIRSVMLKVPNGNIINWAIQCLHPIELREDLDEDIEIEHPDPIREPEEDPNPLILEPELDPAIEDAAPATREAENVVGEVEPDATGSGRECVGNKTTQQTTTTRPGRRVTTPAHSLIVFTSLNCLTPLNWCNWNQWIRINDWERTRSLSVTFISP